MRHQKTKITCTRINTYTAEYLFHSDNLSCIHIFWL
jgi:hypothetical protein